MYYALARIAIPKIRIDYSLTVPQVFQKFAGGWTWVLCCAAKKLNNQDPQ
jgi:hypothetical protein